MAKKYQLRFTSDDESDVLDIADQAWLLTSQTRGRDAEIFMSKTHKESP